MSKELYGFKRIDLQNTGYVFRVVKKGDTYIHTMCEGELLYKLGLKPEDVIGKSLYEFFPEDYSKLKEIYYEQAFQGEFIQYKTELYGVDQVGTLRPVIENGQVVEIVGTSIDISENLKLKEEVTQKKALYKTILQTMSDGIFLYEKSGKITYMNDNVKKILGIQSERLDEEAFNQLDIKLLKEDRSPMSFLELTNKLTVKKVKAHNNCVFGFMDKKGKTKWLSLNSSPINLYSKQEPAVLVSLSDITQLKEQKQEVLELAEFRNYIINTPNAGIVAVDQHNQIKVINDQMCELFSLNKDKKTYLGSYFHDLNLPLNETINEKGTINPKQRVQTVLTTADHKLIQGSYSPIYSQSNEWVGGMWSFNDVTETERLKIKLLKSKEEAERANLAKSEFLSKMSHELRTPLNGILGFAQLLELDEGLNEKQRDFVNEILSGGRHLLDLINEVLDLSKIEKGQFRLCFQDIQIETLLLECLRIVEPMAIRKKITFLNEWMFCDPNDLNHPVPVTLVYADPVRLKQVILNLLDNAIKYNHVGGTVKLSVQKIHERLMVQIKDTGIGIPNKDLDKIFEPFFRVKESNEDGSGIGLAIVRQFLQLMNGDIVVSSQEKVGSSFCFTIPLSRTENRGISSGRNEAKQFVQRFSKYQKKVLYIEDQKANRDFVANLLNDYSNYQLITAVNGQEGLRMAVSEMPDLVLLDLNLPDCNGLDLIKPLKDHPLLKSIPIVAVSARALPSDIHYALDYGCDDYLVKPIQVETLFSTLEQFIQTD